MPPFLDPSVHAVLTFDTLVRVRTVLSESRTLTGKAISI